ncbi:MAG: tetratricopeptide repeat protein [Bdellovibrionales bacterium]
MSKRIDKETLKGPDTFVSTSDKVFVWLHRFRKWILGAVILGIVGSVGWLGYAHLQAQRELAAANAIYPAEAELKKAETKARESRVAQEQEKLGDKKLKAVKKNPEPETVPDYTSLVEKVKSASKEHAGTKAALVSSLNLSSFLLQEKKYPEALEVLNIPTYTPPTSNILGGFWLMHRGVVLLENQKAQEAIEAYLKVLNAPDLKPFHSEAMLKLGVAYELKGDAEKAREAYERLAREFPETEASGQARQFLRLLDLKKQQG